MPGLLGLRHATAVSGSGCHPERAAAVRMGALRARCTISAVQATFLPLANSPQKIDLLCRRHCLPPVQGQRRAVLYKAAFRQNRVQPRTESRRILPSPAVTRHGTIFPRRPAQGVCSAKPLRRGGCFWASCTERPGRREGVGRSIPMEHGKDILFRKNQGKEQEEFLGKKNYVLVL